MKYYDTFLFKQFKMLTGGAQLTGICRKVYDLTGLKCRRKG